LHPPFPSLQALYILFWKTCTSLVNTHFTCHTGSNSSNLYFKLH
jgi:hypothetical protein